MTQGCQGMKRQEYAAYHLGAERGLEGWNWKTLWIIVGVAYHI